MTVALTIVVVDVASINGSVMVVVAALSLVSKKPSFRGGQEGYIHIDRSAIGCDSIEWN